MSAEEALYDLLYNVWGLNQQASREIAELGAKDYIVIPRADLPEVTGPDRAGWYIAGDSTNNPSIGEHPARHMALGYLAIAEYQAQNPPVDEAEVEALAEIVKAEVLTRQQESGSFANWNDIARRLLATGRIEVKR